MVPKMISENMKRIMMFTIDGRELRMVLTRPAIPGMELMVRSGLKILMTLTAEMFDSLNWRENQPRMTTEKSSYSLQSERLTMFQASRR